MDACIVYFSQAVEPFDIESLLEQSIRNNLKWDITGMTFYVRGNIIQVLEGEEQAVETLYRRIEADDRHHKVERILTRPVTQRLFKDYSMGYESISHSQLEEIKAAFPLDKSETTAEEEPLVLRIIRTFYETNRYNQQPPQ